VKWRLADSVNEVNVFLEVAAMVKKMGSLYDNDRTGKGNLLEFMDANDWFGVSYVVKDKAPVVQKKHLKRFMKSLELWLSAYKKPGREKTRLMLEHFDGIYPNTCALFRHFAADGQIENEAATWKLLDYLLSEIDREITEYSESDLEQLIKRADVEATLASARLLADFLSTAVHNGRPLTGWVYDFNSRDAPELIYSAYTPDSYSIMAYCVFNEEWWEKRGMVEKAVQNKAYADMWMFFALHFICALRFSDMARLPAPALPYDGKIVLNKVLSGSFTKQEASSLTEEMVIRLKLKPMKPSKTAANTSIPHLKLFAPESLKAPLGLIMAVALAHHTEITPGSGFVTHCTNLRNIRDFFGETFAMALGHRRFSSRRGNKSYLQGIEAVSPDNSPGKPKAIIL
jgi:hypothetical protein